MRRPPLVVCLAALCIVAGRAQSPTPEDLVKQGRALVSQGKLDEAISVYRKAIKTAPQAFDARLAMGIVLDLQGQYAANSTAIDREQFSRPLACQPGLEVNPNP